jgi:hypothetical protein
MMLAPVIVLLSVATELGKSLEAHPDAKIVLSQPGLGVVLGARVLSEFGDDPDGYPMLWHGATMLVPRRSRAPRGRSASCSPATFATGTWPAPATSGLRRAQRLCGRPRLLRQHRANGSSHEGALRALSNRLVGSTAAFASTA